jgi:hypothetical protein
MVSGLHVEGRGGERLVEGRDVCRRKENSSESDFFDYCEGPSFACTVHNKVPKLCAQRTHFDPPNPSQVLAAARVRVANTFGQPLHFSSSAFRRVFPRKEQSASTPTQKSTLGRGPKRPYHVFVCTTALTYPMNSASSFHDRHGFTPSQYHHQLG